MEAATSTQSLQSSTSHPRGRHHRRPRRGRGNNNHTALDLRPASVAPEPSSSTANVVLQDSAPGRSVEQPTRVRGRSRGRGGRANQSSTVNGRQFGGQLTRHDTDSSFEQSLSVAQLQGDAAVFVPGPKHSNNATDLRQKQPSRPQKRRASKSQAPDIATRTHEDIDNGYYECPICTNEVRRNSKVWSCHDCWTVFHLTCIKKWAANEGSVAQQNAHDDESPHPRQWRCPGCNLAKTQLPQTYSCWCEKEIDPKPLPGLPPHSCGNTCGKERAKRCPHPCNLTCHAGPCPPCSSMGPTVVCFCGKHEVTKRCSETDYENGWSCGEICGEFMPCGDHYCSRPCHEGLCGACPTPVLARCYCGQVEKEIICEEQGELRGSHRTPPSIVKTEVEERQDPAGFPETDTVPETWTGSFDCGNVCGRELDCHEHTCKKTCHAQSAEASHCPRAIDVVTHCPCGKTPLNDLTQEIRKHCTDAIPQCDQQCGTILPCGHPCELLCHSGDCMPCMKTVDTKCRCGRTASKMICHQGRGEPPQCTRSCKIQLNCGRHACLENCCPGERKAAERQSAKRRQRPLGSAPRPIDDGFEAEHICTHECGRLLKCGTHYCQELCHKGPCGSCKEAIFEEISCHCGRTVLQPPLPCGTKPPPCRYPCSRSKTCNHPQVSHNCHEDEVPCPKCPYLVEKHCMCNKKTVKNQPCFLTEVRCGETCSKLLRCGSHSCRKDCHRPGECEDGNGQSCQQPCGKLKKVCGHPDLENRCHAPFPCKEDKPCQSKIYITCSCQSQKREMPCGASKTSEGNTKKTLSCNEECARLERNRKLALALNVDQSAHMHGGDHIPYSTETLNVFAENTKWAQDQEREFRVFADSADEKRLRFKPMRSQQRAFIHALAEDFGLDSESMDPEPHRHVMIWKTPRFVSAPHKTLADALRVRHISRPTSTNTAISDSEDQAQKRAKSHASSEPFNSFVISKPRFGLTVNELRAEINTFLRSDMPYNFDIEFLPSEEVVLKATSWKPAKSDLQQMLQNLKPQLVTAISSKGYGTPELCVVDSSMNILRRESESDGGDGWSRVAAKKAAPKISISNEGSSSTNTYSALGGNDGKVTFAKKHPEKIKKKEVVVDDWEAAELAEEEKELIMSGDEDRVGSLESGDAITPTSSGGNIATAPHPELVDNGSAEFSQRPNPELDTSG